MAGSLRDVLVADAVRTPIGRFRGALAEVRPDDLGAVVIAELVRRAGADPAGIDDVILRLRQPGRRGQPQRRAHEPRCSRACR